MAKNSNSETDIRDAIAPLNKLADDHGIMVFGVRHLSEKECSQGVLAAILGSSSAGCRSLARCSRSYGTTGPWHVARPVRRR